MKRLYSLFLVVFLLAACAQLGLVRPESVPDRLAYGYATLSQVAEATVSLLEQKKISKQTAQQVHKGLVVAFETLNEARDLYYSGKIKDAGSKLEAALKAIGNVQKRLKGEKDA